MSLSPDLVLMAQAARKAGEALRHDFAHRDELLVVTKQKGDFVSQADQKSEKLIVETLLAGRPDWGVLGEEGSDIEGKDKFCRWIIDPLDATTNFLHGIPHWSITIALQKHGEIVAGLIFDPVVDEMFTAEKGHGAFLNGKRIHVSSQDDFSRSLISFNAGYLTFNDETQRVHAADWQKGIAAGATMCSMGGLALQMAYVAAGRYTLCRCWRSMPWDFCAGQLLIEEAGGVVTDFVGGDVDFNLGEVVAANPVLHDRYLRLMGLR